MGNPVLKAPALRNLGGSDNEKGTAEILISQKKLVLLLRDGRELLGILRSFDQHANIVLEGACERVIVGNLYSDIHLGLYIIRGENVVFLGELDQDTAELPSRMIQVSAEEIKKAEKAERGAESSKVLIRKQMEFLDFD